MAEAAYAKYGVRFDLTAEEVIEICKESAEYL